MHASSIREVPNPAKIDNGILEKRIDTVEFRMTDHCDVRHGRYTQLGYRVSQFFVAEAFRPYFQVRSVDKE